MKRLVWGLLVCAASSAAHADCVVGAKLKQTYVIIDAHTIILQGGVGQDIIIKTFSFLQQHSRVTVLKDSFCDFEPAVLYVDGEVVDAQQVKQI